MKRKKSRFTTRLPSDLDQWLREYAEKNGNSANQQLTNILEKEKALSATNTQGFNANTTTVK